MGRFSNEQEIEAARRENADRDAKQKRDADTARQALSDAEEVLRVARRADLEDFHAAAERHDVPTRAFLRQGLSRYGYMLSSESRTYFLDATEFTLFEVRGTHNEGRIVDLASFSEAEWDLLMDDAMSFLRGDRGALTQW